MTKCDITSCVTADCNITKKFVYGPENYKKMTTTTTTTTNC